MKTAFRSKKWSLITLLAFGLIGLLTYVSFRHQAFRWASLDLTLTRSEATEKSRQFLQSQELDLSYANHSVAFWTFESPLLYLEKTVGTSQTNHWLKTKNIPVWGWEVRFFWPLQKEEYRVWWSPKGEFLGFQHHLLREKKLQSLSSSKALEKAERFVSQIFKTEFSQYDLVETSSDQKSHRKDHYFGWKKKESLLRSRSYIRATVSGNQVSSIRKEIELPQEFYRNEQEVQSRRNLLSKFTKAFDWLLVLVIFIFLIRAWGKHWVRWRPAVLLTLLLALGEFLYFLNTLPLTWHSYQTHETLMAFWMDRGGSLLIFLIASSLMAALQFSSADTIGRLQPNARYSLGELFRSSFFHSREFFLATFAGFCGAGIQLGFVVLFYSWGRQLLGFYSPVTVPYNDVLTSALPWIQPLLTGLSPSLHEESVYRLFAIPLLLRLTKKPWIAVLVPALLWGFLHSDYYIEPIYARGIELTFIGILLGILFLRFGIWSTLVAHYAYNATISSSLLLTSEDPYLQFSSLGVIFLIAVPFLWSLFKTLKGHKFQTFEFARLTWEKTKTQTWSGTNRRRIRRIQRALSVRTPAILGLAAVIILFLLPGRADLPQTPIDREKAFSRATAFLTSEGYDVSSHLKASLIQEPSRGLAAKYIQETLPAKQSESYLNQYEPLTPYWALRFVSQTSTHRCTVRLNSFQTLISFSCREDENQTLSRISKETSIKKARDFLIRQGFDVSKLTYSGVLERDQANRKDLIHRWRDPQAEIKDLKRFVQVRMAGSRVSSFDTYFQVPESYQRKQGQKTAGKVFRQILFVALMIFMAVLVIRSLFDRKAIGSIFEPLALWGGGITFAVYLLNGMNQWPSFWWSYDSAYSYPIYVFQVILSEIGEALSTGVLAYLAILLFLRFVPHIFPSSPTYSEIQTMVKRPPWRWRSTRESFLWAFALIFIQISLRKIFTLVYPDIDLFETNVASFSSLYPFSSLPISVWNGLLFWTGIGALLAIGRRYLKSWLGLIILLLPIVYGDIQSGTDMILHSTELLAVVIVVFRVVQFHLPFYFWYLILSSSFTFFPWLISGEGMFWKNAAIVFLFLAFFTAPLLRLKSPPIHQGKIYPVPKK